MKCPHCQTEIPEDAHMCGYCGKKLPEPRQQASSSPCHRAQGDLPEQVSVLATLPDKGLQKVYYGSLFLQGMGLLQYGIAFTLLVVLAILIFVMINDNELSLHDILIWSISFLSIFVLFAIGYVMRNIRIRLTRIIIRVLALFAIASSGYLLFVVFKEEGAIASTFFLVPLAIWGITWLACGIHPLFGGNSPSHEQISHVWLRRKKHLDLDTACPPPRHPSRIDKVFLLASWIWLPLAVLTTLAIMIPSYWGQRDNEELLLEESPIPEEQVVGAWNINGGFFKKEGITYVIEQYGSYYAVVYSANKNQGNDEGLVLRGHWQLGGKNGKPLLVMTMEGGPDLTSDQGRYFVLSVSEEEMVLSGFKSGGEWHWKKAATDSLEVIAAQKLYEKVSPQSGCIISNRCLRYHKENGKVVRVETEGFSYENRPEEQEESIFKNLFRLGEIKADLSADLAKLMAKKKSDAVDKAEEDAMNNNEAKDLLAAIEYISEMETLKAKLDAAENIDAYHDAVIELMRVLPVYWYWSEFEYERKRMEEILSERYERFIKNVLENGRFKERPKKNFDVATFMRENGINGVSIRDYLKEHGITEPLSEDALPE